MPTEPCPMHSDEQSTGVFLGAELGWSYTCSLDEHPRPGPYTWIREPVAPDLYVLTGIAAERSFDLKITDVLRQRIGVWIEYGVLEHDFALAFPEDWKFLIDRYGHTAIAATQYSSSSFLAGTLGRLGRAGVVDVIAGPATGRWGPNGVMKYKQLGYFALPPGLAESHLLSCDVAGITDAYVHGRSDNA